MQYGTRIDDQWSSSVGTYIEELRRLLKEDPDAVQDAVTGRAPAARARRKRAGLAAGVPFWVAKKDSATALSWQFPVRGQGRRMSSAPARLSRSRLVY